jgi:hypothetical protein
VVEPRDRLGIYGMFDYGDLMCSHSASPAAIWGLFKDDPDSDIRHMMKRCSKAYNNEANDQLNSLWGFYLHTGRKDHFRLADAYGRHMADVDFYHEGESSGLIRYHGDGHWTGSGAPCHSTITGLMLQYYLTGNRRLLDVCIENAEFSLRHTEPCGIMRMRGSLMRTLTTQICNLQEVYQATWDHKYGSLARRSLKWLLKSLPEPGCWPVTLHTAGPDGDEARLLQNGWRHLLQAGGMIPQMLHDAVLMYDSQDPIFTASLKGYVDRLVFGPEKPSGRFVMKIFGVGQDGLNRTDPAQNVTVVPYLYKLTRDIRYAAFCVYYVEQWFDFLLDDSNDFGILEFNFCVLTFSPVQWGSIIPVMMRAITDAESDHGTQELASATAEYIAWLEAEYGEAPFTHDCFDRDVAWTDAGRIEGYE